MIRIYYRISDQSYPKQKLPGACKRTCFQNFMDAMGGYGDQMTIIADNCTTDTIQYLQDIRRRVIVTNEGNAGSFRFAVDKALSECKPNDLIYFVEDDYLHRPGSAEALVAADAAGIADYLTVYDHPDKYSEEYNEIPALFCGESSRVRRIGSQHWRYTKSTTMTFACRVSTMIVDRDVWMKQTAGDHPNDHIAFTELMSLPSIIRQRGTRLAIDQCRLAVAIPGLACHVDLTWGNERGKFAMEPWAIEMMAKNNDPGK